MTSPRLTSSHLHLSFGRMTRLFVSFEAFVTGFPFLRLKSYRLEVLKLCVDVALRLKPSWATLRHAKAVPSG